MFPWLSKLRGFKESENWRREKGIKKSQQLTIFGKSLASFPVTKMIFAVTGERTWRVFTMQLSIIICAVIFTAIQSIQKRENLEGKKWMAVVFVKVNKAKVSEEKIQWQ